jgi:RHS repeat-associated protein
MEQPLSGTWAGIGTSAYAWVYLHQGGRYEATSGLYSFRLRDCSSTLGRWAEVDPLGFAGGDHNLYRAVGNDPANTTDPSGEKAGLFDKLWNWFFGDPETDPPVKIPPPPPGSKPLKMDCPPRGGTSVDNWRYADPDLDKEWGPAWKNVEELAKEGAQNYLTPATAASPGNRGRFVRSAVSRLAPKRVTGDALAKMRSEFNTAKPQAWKEEAARNPQKYTKKQLAAMKKGEAPIGSDGFPMEIHHKTPLAEGGTNTMDNFDFLTRTDHRLGPNYKKNHPNLP